MKVKVELDDEAARALYRRLLTPTRDNAQQTVYTIGVQFVAEFRTALWEALDGKV